MLLCLSHFGKTPAKSLTLEMRLPSPSLRLPGQSPFFTPTAERKKKSKQLLYPKICGQSQQRRGRRPGGTSEFWSNFQTKAAERSRGQVPRFEVLTRIAQSTTLSGQAAPLFLLLGVRAGVHANPTPSTAFSGSVPPGPVPQSAGLCLGAEPKAFPPES